MVTTARLKKFCSPFLELIEFLEKFKEVKRYSMKTYLPRERLSNELMKKKQFFNRKLVMPRLRMQILLNLEDQ